MQGNRLVVIEHSWAASDEDNSGDGMLPRCLEPLPGLCAKSCSGNQALATPQQHLYLLLPSWHHQQYLLGQHLLWCTSDPRTAGGQSFPGPWCQGLKAEHARFLQGEIATGRRRMSHRHGWRKTAGCSFPLEVALIYFSYFWQLLNGSFALPLLTIALIYIWRTSKNILDLPSPTYVWARASPRGAPSFRILLQR